MPQRDEDPLSAVCDALEELAKAQDLALAETPSLARLRDLALERREKRELTRKAWLTLAAAFHEAADEAERMAS